MKKSSAYITGWRQSYRIGGSPHPEIYKTKTARENYMRGFNKGMDDFERW